MKKTSLYQAIMMFVIIFIPSAVQADTLYKMSRILVTNEGEALRIISRLNNGMHFSNESLIDNNIQAHVDNIGWTYLDEMSPEFSVIRNVSKGYYTKKPIKSWLGYAIIRVDDLKKKKKPALNVNEFVLVNTLMQHVPDIDLKKTNKGIYVSNKKNINLKINNLSGEVVESASISIKYNNEKPLKEVIHNSLPTLRGFILGSNPNISKERAELIALDLISSVKRLTKESLASRVSNLELNYSLSITNKIAERKEKYIFIEITTQHINSTRAKIYSSLSKKHDSIKNKSAYFDKISIMFGK